MTTRNNDSGLEWVLLPTEQPDGEPVRAPITEDNTRLVHDARLSGQFLNGVIRTSELQPGEWSATVELAMLVAGAQRAIDVAKDIMARHPDYIESGSYTVVFVYERLGLGIPAGDYLDEVLSGPPGFREWINLLWTTGYRASLGAYFQMTSVGPVVHTDAEEIAANWRFMPMIADANKTRLIDAVRMRQYLLMHQGIGLVADGKPMILHTNGGEHFTDHPDFGVVPGALRYIDLQPWDGESRIFGESDLGDIA